MNNLFLTICLYITWIQFILILIVSISIHYNSRYTKFVKYELKFAIPIVGMFLFYKSLKKLR